MPFQSLKPKLVFNLALLLLLAVCLTDFVVVRIIERNLVQERIRYGGEFISALAPFVSEGDRNTQALDAALAAAGRPFLVHAFFSIPDAPAYRFGLLPPDAAFDPAKQNQTVILEAGPRSLFLGDTWGVFWKQSKYVAVTQKFSAAPDAGAAATVLIRLDDIYESLRKSQRLVLIYSLANLLLLASLGLFRLNRIVIRPIRRFIQVTDQLQSSEQFPAYPGKRNNEFSQLSNAIQQMARRIEADRGQIKSSLASLEAAHKKLKDTQNEMIRAEKLASVGRLSAGIAHEIGNPIGIVLGYVSLLKTRPAIGSDRQALDYLSRAESEINRINQIITQLLDFARTSPGEQEVISVHELVEEVGQMLAEQPFMRNIRLGYHLAASSDRIQADGQQLRQVLVNLLINAADSIAVSENSGNGEIHIETGDAGPDQKGLELSGEALFLTVSDNGTGIANADIDNIFDPFYTTKAPGEGTGLGLSVSYMIVEQFGGTIEVRNRLQQGTSMILYLPLAAK